MVDMNVNINGADGPNKKNNNKVSSYLTGDNSAQQSGILQLSSICCIVLLSVFLFEEDFV